MGSKDGVAVLSSEGHNQLARAGLPWLSDLDYQMDPSGPFSFPDERISRRGSVRRIRIGRREQQGSLARFTRAVPGGGTPVPRGAWGASREELLWSAPPGVDTHK